MEQFYKNELIYIITATTFPTPIVLKGGHIQGSLLYQCILHQLKDPQFGEGLNSSHPNCPLINIIILKLLSMLRVVAFMFTIS